MKNKLLKKAVASVMASAFICSAAPTGLSGSLLFDSSITANAEDETKEYTLDFNEDTGELHLSGVFPQYSGIPYEYKEKVTKITCTPGTVFPESASYMFSGFTKLTAVDLTGADFSRTKEARGFFSSCYKLESVDLTRTDFSAVTTMERMFRGCLKLKSITGLKASSSDLQSLDGLFMDCLELRTADVSGLNTSNVTTFAFMFSSCNRLESVNLTGIDTSSAMSFNQMFASCYALSSIDLSGFNTSNVKDMYKMFLSCNSLTSIDLSSFDTSNVGRMDGMFSGCISLKKLDLTPLEVDSCQRFKDIISDCRSLEELDISNFNEKTLDITGNELSLDYCYSLSKIKVGSGIHTIKASSFNRGTFWANEKDPGTNVIADNVINNSGENTYILNEDKGHFKSAGIEIDRNGTIGLRLFVDLPDTLTEEEKNSAYAMFMYDIGSGSSADLPIKKDADGNYYVLKPTLAKEMACSYIICLKVGGDTVDTVRYSVRQYADQILADPVKYAKEQDLIRSMLVYGGAVQRHFKFDLDDSFAPFIDSGISYSKTVVNDANHFVAPKDLSGLSYEGSSIVLGSGVVQRHYFKLTDGAIEDYKFMVDGKSVTPTEKEEGLCYVDAVKNASMMKLYTPSEISVYKTSDASKKMEFEYSVMDYVRLSKRVSGYSDTAAEVVRTLSWLADEAKEYITK
ncbi:BspA family leucine-rich repeat surface protein [Ruminococcus flavefaciens]|uniref:BspA family leucine-rich repeat surface protein n=1 Tax=Ruminococcus flavefaciens TaxID=1265 RepID=UPI00048CABA6|nr:BspA family leucine-rich repeat surface protein [Ruminococcus flavefaciens]